MDQNTEDSENPQISNPTQPSNSNQELGNPILPDAQITTPPAGDISPKPNKFKPLFIILGIFVLLAIFLSAISIMENVRQNKFDAEFSDEVVQDISPTPQVSFKGTLTYVEGSIVKVGVQGNTDLFEGDEVVQGDVLQTGENAMVMLMFDDGSVVRLGPGSKIALTKLLPSEMLITQDGGSLYSRVEKSEGHTFTILAGEVRIQALGTAFSVEKGESVKVNVYESEVKVIEAQKEIQVTAKNQWRQGDVLAAELDTAEVENDNFLQWALDEEIARMNLEIISTVSPQTEGKDKEAYKTALESLGIDKKELQKEAFLKTTSGSVSSTVLSGQKLAEGGVSLSWMSDGLADGGFKVIWSQTPGVTDPGEKRTSSPIYGYQKTLGSMKPGSTWYYKVCELVEGTCGAYSNELSFSF